ELKEEVYMLSSPGFFNPLDNKPYREGFRAFVWQILILVTISKIVFRHLKLFKGFKVQLGEDPIRDRRVGLRVGEEGTSSSPQSNVIKGAADVPKALTKLVTHLEKWKALVINAEPISDVHPSDIAKNIMDSRNTSSKEGGLSPIGPDAPSYLEVGKRSKVAGKRKVVVGSHGEDLYRKAQKVHAQASKVAGDASTLLDVDSNPDVHEFTSAKELKNATDCNWVVAHVTPPSWKKYLRTQELIFALHKAMASYDNIQEREIKKDKAEYSRIILEENMWINYEQTLSTLRAKVKGLRSKGKGLRAFEIQLLQEVDSLRQDRVAVVARVILDAIMKLIRSDEMSVLIARFVNAYIIHGRCAAFEEVAKLKKPFVLDEMPDYRPSSKEEYGRAGNDLANASYPFLAELTADPHASVEQLLSKKPQSLQSKCLSSKAS
nr:hypothetical protein [Tanacetum cinerariifolium]